MKEGGGKWIRLQFLTLAALLVCIEDETSIVDASEEHHSGGGATLGRRCGDGHRLGHGFASSSRNLEPHGQLSHRVWVDRSLFHDHSLLPLPVACRICGRCHQLRGPGGRVSGSTSQRLPFRP